VTVTANARAPVLLKFESDGYSPRVNMHYRIDRVVRSHTAAPQVTRREPDGGDGCGLNDFSGDR
jgi:hypothetical protein